MLLLLKPPERLLPVRALCCCRHCLRVWPLLLLPNIRPCVVLTNGASPLLQTNGTSIQKPSPAWCCKPGLNLCHQLLMCCVIKGASGVSWVQPVWSLQPGPCHSGTGWAYVDPLQATAEPTGGHVL